MNVILQSYCDKGDLYVHLYIIIWLYV